VIGRLDRLELLGDDADVEVASSVTAASGNRAGDEDRRRLVGNRAVGRQRRECDAGKLRCQLALPVCHENPEQCVRA
jgi:hypothetical protein